MTREAEFFSGSLLERHWVADDGGVATVAVKKKKKSTKKSTKRKKRVKKTSLTSHFCYTGKKTCRDRGCP
jgi:hypothetical protein